MNALDALRLVDFEWVVRLGDVWRAPLVDIPELHPRLRAEFVRKLDAMERSDGDSSPLGWVIAGAGGTGKTHLLGAFRRETTRRGLPFIMVDMTDVRNFWGCVLQGYVGSLQQVVDDDAPQYQRALGNVIEKLKPNKPVADVLATLSERKSRYLREDMNKVLAALGKIRPRETREYQNIIRALICMNSEDFALSSLGQTWLLGTELEDEDKRALGFTTRGEQPRKIIKALSWMLSLGGPTVLAFDQLDPIVTELHHLKHGAAIDEATSTAEAIITEIGGGLGALRDATHNTLTIVSCVETTWEYLRGAVLKTFIDRFESPWRLSKPPNDAVAKALVEGRLAAAHRESGFAPPYPTYPFRPEAFQGLQSASPREILQRCAEHRNTCLYQDAIAELTTFQPSTEPPIGPTNGRPIDEETTALKRLDDEFQKLRAEADPAWLLEERYDDERLAPLILSGLKRLVEETEFGPDVTPQIDAELTGGAKTRPLHARLRLIFHKKDDREEHSCVRALQWTNDRAFQARLKAALTQSGIDRSLNFRRLAIIRSLSKPNGELSRKLIDEFERNDGVFISPTEDDLRTLCALHRMNGRKDADFSKWLKDRRPASSLDLIQQIVNHHPIFQTPGAPAKVKAPVEVEEPSEVEAPPKRGPVTSDPTSVDPPTPQLTTTSPSDTIKSPPRVSTTPTIPLGRRLQAGKPVEMIGLPVKLMEKHTLILAGSGSGKTVLLKRLIEEAAIVGVPSIVIDGANDLAALDERWDEPPATWTDDDGRKADAYHAPGRVVVWTPGKESGNPLSLEPVPDLAPVADDAEELDAATSMAVATLSPQVAKGNAKSNLHKRAILKQALVHMAGRGGGRLNELVELLSDLPPEAGPGLGNETKLAKAMSDDLRAAIVMDPLLRSIGAPIDPAVLFGSNQPEASARVSVVSLVGLSGLEAQRNFVNQLAMTLFAWIKKNPDYGDQPLCGLLVIDEARDFAPSQKASACGESLVRLTSQARKYGLGIIFATQNPKDIDNKLVGNCSSHFYGKMNAPAAVDATRDMIQAKGGTADDISKLAAGEFYFHNADIGLARPTKILTSMCLSRHPKTVLDEATILAKAAASRP